MNVHAGSRESLSLTLQECLHVAVRKVVMPLVTCGSSECGQSSIAISAVIFVAQDTAAAAAAYTPDANALDAFWERTEALLARRAPDSNGGDAAEAEVAGPKQLSLQAQALTAAKLQAVAAAGRLVAFQVTVRYTLDGCKDRALYAINFTAATGLLMMTVSVREGHCDRGAELSHLAHSGCCCRQSFRLGTLERFVCSGTDFIGDVVSSQALSSRDAEVLAGRLVMHLGSPDKAVADAVREVTRVLKKADPDALPEVCSLSCLHALLPIPVEADRPCLCISFLYLKFRAGYGKASCACIRGRHNALLVMALTHGVLHEIPVFFVPG